MSKGLEEGYSSLMKIFRSATGERAHRWLTLKCEPHSATQRVTEGGSNPLVPVPKKQKNNRALWARLSFYLARQEKPKSNTMFGLGFLFCLFAVGVDGGLCRERLLTRVGSVVGSRAKGKQSSPSGLGWLASLPITHTPERLVSRVPWNK